MVWRDTCLTWKTGKRPAHFHEVTYIRMFITLKHYFHTHTCIPMHAHTHTRTSSSFTSEYLKSCLIYQCKGENGLLINAEHVKQLYWLSWDHSRCLYQETKVTEGWLLLTKIFPSGYFEKCNNSLRRLKKISYLLCQALAKFYHVSLRG